MTRCSRESGPWQKCSNNVLLTFTSRVHDDTRFGFRLQISKRRITVSVAAPPMMTCPSRRRGVSTYRRAPHSVLNTRTHK